MANQEFAGFAYTDAGVAINGATVNLYDRNTTTPVRATTTTNSSGYWAISHATEGRFDYEVVNGSSIRRFKYDSYVQMEGIEVAQLRIRNPADTFDYDIVSAAITADRALNLPLITQTATLAAIDHGIKGADISSVGAALTLVAGSDFADVTGTTTVTSISTRPAGSRFTFQFDGILILTHNATSLILQGGVNLTTAAGDVVTFISEGSGNWREVSRRLVAAAAGGTVTSVTGTAPIASSGGATPAISLNDAGVTLAKMADIATARIIGRNTALTGVPEALATLPTGVMPAFTGDVTSAGGALALTIANDAVTYAKMQNVSATDMVLGRTTAGAGDVEEIATTGSGSVVRATSPSLVTPLLGTPTSGVMTNVTGLPTAGLLDDAVTYAKMQNISATARLLGRNTAGAGDTEEVTPTQATAMLDAATATVKGLVPTPPNNTTTFLRGDATFAAPASSGAVTRDGGNTTQATTTSTTAANLQTATVSIATGGIPWEATWIIRKTTGAAASASVGYTLNTLNAQSPKVFTGTADEVNSGFAWAKGNTWQTGDYDGGHTLILGSSGLVFSFGNLAADITPNATITSFITRGLVGNALVTMGSDELHVYEYAVS